MKRIYIGLWLGSMTILLGASTTSLSTNRADQSAKPARLLREIKADATQIQSAAARLDSMTQSSSATWIDYDHQWNQIKPVVEDMQMKLARLEAMQSTLSSAQRTELDQSKPLIGEIQSRTHEFLSLLDTPGTPTTDAKFKMYARGLKDEASKLEKIAPAS